MEFKIATVNGYHILYVMAATAEYGPKLQERIKPLMTGIGPIEAAIQLTHALSVLQTRGELPHLVVSLGSAGSKNLEQAAIYQAKSLSYRDMDASALGFEKGVTPFIELPVEVQMPLQMLDIPAARLSTGANIVSGTAYDSIDADMVDMESYAILRCCQKFGVKMLGLRGISDGATELKHLSGWTQYLHVIDAKLANAVDLLHKQLKDSAISI